MTSFEMRRASAYLAAVVSILASTSCGSGSSKGEVSAPANHSKTIADCLTDARSDLAVSDWLDQKTQHADLKALPREVVVAFRADRFLNELNSEGCLGFFEGELAGAQDTVVSLKEIGLPDTAKNLSSIMGLLSPKGWPTNDDEFISARQALDRDAKRTAAFEALDDRLLGDSAKIQAATLDYIRVHVDKFKKLD